MQVNKWIGISPGCSLLSAAIALEAQRHKNYQFSKQPSLFGLLIISQQSMQVNKWIGISPCCSLLSAAIA